MRICFLKNYSLSGFFVVCSLNQYNRLPLLLWVSVLLNNSWVFEFWINLIIAIIIFLILIITFLKCSMRVIKFNIWLQVFLWLLREHYLALLLLLLIASKIIKSFWLLGRIFIITNEIVHEVCLRSSSFVTTQLHLNTVVFVELKFSNMIFRDIEI